MDTLNEAIVNSSAIQPIDYSSPLEVSLAVDSSYIACGWILYQLDTEGRCHPVCFSLITWNERESHYSQAKIELYGLFCALKAAKVWLIGLKSFTMEVDAKYIKGMLCNPDIHPNAAVNRWIVGISFFNFMLNHVPGLKHAGLDRLSHRPGTPEDEEDQEEMSEEVDEWVDEILGCGIWVVKELDEEWPSWTSTLVLTAADTTHTSDIDIPSTETFICLDNELHAIRTYLDTFSFPSSTPSKDYSCLTKCSFQFFIQGNCLWRKDSAG
jgi:hypothetical protein